MKATVITLENKPAGEIELADEVFAAPVRKDLLQRMITYQLAKRRAGTHKTKQRNEVSGTGAKLFRQKGTGRARRSDGKAPQFRGGGRAFGPKPRDHAIELPKKVRIRALRAALSAKQADGKLIILDEARTDTPKTKAIRQKLDALGWSNALIVAGPEVDGNLALATRNLPGIDLLPTQGANVYDILRCDVLVLTKDAVEGLEARLK